jgi:hypothetical protein
MSPGEAALVAEVAALKARLLRLERRIDALGLDTVPGLAASDESAPVGDGALLDAIGDGFDALASAFKGP